MAGPTVGILVPKKINEKTENIILEYIHKVSNEVSGNDFWVNSRPFIFWLGPEYPDELEEYSELKVISNWNPKDIIGLCAMCNDLVDHQELGKLTLEITNLVNGKIAFGHTLNYYTSDPEILESTELVELKGESIMSPKLFSIWLKHQDFRMVK